MEKTTYDYIGSRIENLKKNYASFRTEQDYHNFIIVCLKYFYFAGANFDPEFVMQEYVTDGKDDGGIDAVFNDQSSENNDMVIVQSKYYKSSPLSDEDVTAELIKIANTIHDIDNCKIENYNADVVSAYRNAKSAMSDDGEIKIVFFTSFQPKDKRARNKIEKFVLSNFKDYDVQFAFRDDIVDQIDMVDNGQSYVDYDTLEIDTPKNFLKYEDSVIVNISAKSLQDLSIKRRNGLLGMNLRYYVKKKDVDKGIEASIKKHPADFWYKNNGVVIVCENWEISGTYLKLWNFSIVNGGQTTNRIAHSDIDSDFYLQCKVVQTKGETDDKKEQFIMEIAEATNSQKKIDTADMKANTPEQNNLRERLNHQHVYYITKRGDKVPTKQYPMPYESATMTEVGKIGLAAILQMPGSARSNPARMFQDEYYYSIYGKSVNEKIITDALKIDYYYTQFLKTEIKDKGYDEATVLPMLRNGKTFQIACLVLLSKLLNEVFTYEDVSNLFNNQDALKKLLMRTDGMDRVIARKVDEEQELIFKMFSYIGEDVLGVCFDNALEKAEGDLIPSNYLKSDTTYYKDVIKRLWSQYNKNKDLKSAAQLLFKK